MVTDKQVIKIRNAIANDILEPKLKDYALRFERSKTVPDTMLTLEIKFSTKDLKTKTTMFQFSDIKLGNILMHYEVIDYTISCVTFTVFPDSMDIDCHIHLKD